MSKLWIILIGLVVVLGVGLSFWGIPAPKGEIRKEIPHDQFTK